jgi:hypothetical protein
MMTWIIRKVRILSLLIAAFVFNAHMIIPHDHHLLDSDSCQYPVSQRSHNSGFPHHCHAFNGLASEKANNYIIIKYQNIDFTIFCDAKISNQNTPFVRYYDNRKPTISSGISNYASLRAPPSLI